LVTVVDRSVPLCVVQEWCDGHVYRSCRTVGRVTGTTVSSPSRPLATTGC
jgi:hypothetical protein